MDLAFEKVRPFVIHAGEQVLVGIVLAFHVTVFALLTIPESITSVVSLGELAWDQLSSPGPHAPAGDLSFRLFKIWTSHVVDVELPRFRNFAARFDAKLASSLSSFDRRRNPGFGDANSPRFSSIVTVFCANSPAVQSSHVATTRVLRGRSRMPRPARELVALGLRTRMIESELRDFGVRLPCLNQEAIAKRPKTQRRPEGYSSAPVCARAAFCPNTIR